MAVTPEFNSEGSIFTFITYYDFNKPNFILFINLFHKFLFAYLI